MAGVWGWWGYGHEVVVVRGWWGSRGGGGVEKWGSRGGGGLGVVGV